MTPITFPEFRDTFIAGFGYFLKSFFGYELLPGFDEVQAIYWYPFAFFLALTFGHLVFSIILSSIRTFRGRL